MSDRVLPSNVDYTKILPLAVESRSRRRSFFPTNGQTFASGGNNIIRIDVAASAFLDTKHSYLRFRYTNDAANTCGFDFGGGHGFIRRLRIEQAGNVLSDCNHYNKLMSAIILPCQGGIDSVAHRSLTEGQRFANNRAQGTSMAPCPAADVSGAIVNTPANSSEVVDFPGGAGGSLSYTFSIPLMNGLLGSTQDKMVPLQMLGSSPITIEIELADGLDIGAYGGFLAAPTYTIDNVRYIAQLVEVGPEVDAQLRMVQEVSGGKLVLNGVDYSHFNGNIAAGATGVQTINVPARRKSLKSLFFVGASQAYGGAGAGSHSQSFNLSYGGNMTLSDYQIKIGSVVYPPTPVQCDWNGPAGTSAFTRGEAFSELSKCWGSVSSVNGTGSLSTLNYARNAGNVATIPQDPGGAVACVSYEFCPLAMDLESFQRTALESGVNTADRSLPISLLLNVGGGIALEQINIDAYVAYDSLYFIDSVGNIRVSM
tara:strand:+ start:538 stop:1986 length:1449 start_codon:yes stop_codon:yes gene_type:complete